MKTDTKDRILRYIEKQGLSRPHDIAIRLKLSPQIIHRHLKDLVTKGLIEAKGRPPTTHYSLANLPYFSKAMSWIKKGESNSKITTDYLCETRDVFTGRLGNFLPLGLKEGDLPLVIAVSGEIGNNSFDHNLGKWRDQPGCWFEIQTTRDKLWVLIGDRGQGIRSSLIQVKPTLKNDQEALHIAFEERVSARAPERRGNGLKFVRTSVASSIGAGVACISGEGQVHYGEFGSETIKVLSQNFKGTPGTVTLISWNLK